MTTSKDYWEKRYSGLNPEAYDFSKSRPSPVLIDFCEKYLRNNATILDLGCGRGRHAYHLAQRGYRVSGVDVAEGAVEFCQKQFTLHNLPGTFKQGSLDHIPFPDHTFVGLICIATIGHALLETAQAAIVEMRRVLTPGGAVLLSFDVPAAGEDFPGDTEVCPDGTLRFLQGEQAGMLLHRYTDEEIKSLLGEKNILSFVHTEDGDRIIVCR